MVEIDLNNKEQVEWAEEFNKDDSLTNQSESTFSGYTIFDEERDLYKEENQKLWDQYRRYHKKGNEELVREKLEKVGE